jgi:hypothetical protein
MKPSLCPDAYNRKVFESRLLSALSLVSGQIYIGDMRVNPENQASSAAVFMEVPKPVNLMTPSEKNDFIEEILKALEGN